VGPPNLSLGPVARVTFDYTAGLTLSSMLKATPDHNLRVSLGI